MSNLLNSKVSYAELKASAHRQKITLLHLLVNTEVCIVFGQKMCRISLGLVAKWWACIEEGATCKHLTLLLSFKWWSKFKDN